MDSTIQTGKRIAEKLREIFEHKYLSEHLYDDNYLIRYAVCETGFGLDILLHDPEPVIRRQVAMQQYGLDILIEDSDEWVRAAVAQQGYGLDTLIHDESRHVRNIAIRVKSELENNSNLNERISRAEMRENRLSNCFSSDLYQRGRTVYDKRAK